MSKKKKAISNNLIDNLTLFYVKVCYGLIKMKIIGIIILVGIHASFAILWAII